MARWGPLAVHAAGEPGVRSAKPCPRTARADISHGAPRAPVVGGNGGAGARVCADRTDLRLGQLSLMVGLAAWRTLALCLVARILPVGAIAQVRRFHASGGIARVQDDQGRRAHMALGNNAVRHHGAGCLSLHSAVAVRGDISGEDQTPLPPLGLRHHDVIRRHAATVYLPRSVHVLSGAPALAMPHAPGRPIPSILGPLTSGVLACFTHGPIVPGNALPGTPA